MTKRMKKRAKARSFHVWAEVGYTVITVEFSADATDDECAAACQEALDVLISNGDTGWKEVTEDEDST